MKALSHSLTVPFLVKPCMSTNLSNLSSCSGQLASVVLRRFSSSLRHIAHHLAGPASSLVAGLTTSPATFTGRLSRPGRRSGLYVPRGPALVICAVVLGFGVVNNPPLACAVFCTQRRFPALLVNRIVIIVLFTAAVVVVVVIVAFDKVFERVCSFVATFSDGRRRLLLSVYKIKKYRSVHD